MINNYVNEGGLRQDGRRAHEVRKIDCKLGVISTSDGSAWFGIGNTLVYASVNGPQHSWTKEGRRSYNSGTIICNVETNEFSMSEHHSKNRYKKRDKLLSQLIEETFSSLIILKLYPRSTIDINVEIMQNDGGYDIAAINGVCLALIDAGIAMNDYCVACNAGYLAGYPTPCLDLNYFELNGTKAIDKSTNVSKSETLSQGSNRRQTANSIYQKYNQNDKNEKKESSNANSNEKALSCGVVTVAMMPNSKKIVTAQMQSMMQVENFQKLIDSCANGCQNIYSIMANVVKRHSFKLLQHRGFV